MLWSEEPSQWQLSGSVWAQDARALFPARPGGRCSPTFGWENLKLT